MASNKETVNSAAETCKFEKPTKFNQELIMCLGLMLCITNCYKKTSIGISSYNN